jgi:carnitine O-acetyltransferase
MDGMPMIAFSDYITKQSYASAKAKSSTNIGMKGGEGVEDIFANCYPTLTLGNSRVESMISKGQLCTALSILWYHLDNVFTCIYIQYSIYGTRLITFSSFCITAKSDFCTLVSDHEQHVQSFQGYGGTFIKKAGYSPDAYAQMAIQVAAYRLHGKQVGTYEATQMRPFLHGRTETTRTVSKESALFVKRMGMLAIFQDNAASVDKKKILLKNAVNSHVKYIGGAAKGKGVDRHFFGMAMLADEKDKIPDLYSDPVFIRSKTWKVSTSHLTHENIENWGFGEVVPDGLGVAYAVKSDSCIFNISARKEHGWTEKFGHLLEEALLEMKGLHESSPPASKL